MVGLKQPKPQPQPPSPPRTPPHGALNSYLRQMGVQENDAIYTVRGSVVRKKKVRETKSGASPVLGVIINHYVFINVL